MCIIIAKHAGKEYDKTELVEAFKVAKIHNSHGAGFALKRAEDKSKVILSKGYLYYYDIMLDKLDELDIQKDDELMVHLRFATAGNIDKANCHPFVVSDNINEIMVDEIESEKPVLSHNGTFGEFKSSTSPYSDTVNFVKDFASGEGVLEGLQAISKKDHMKASYMIYPNRICVIFPGDKPMMRLGDWNRIDKEDFCFVYSNLYWKHAEPSKAYGGKNPHKV